MTVLRALTRWPPFVHEYVPRSRQGAPYPLDIFSIPRLSHQTSPIPIPDDLTAQNRIARPVCELHILIWRVIDIMMQHGVVQSKGLHLTLGIPYAEVRISPGEDGPFLWKTVELSWVTAGDADEILDVNPTFEDTFEKEREAGFETWETVWDLFEEGFAVDYAEPFATFYVESIASKMGVERSGQGEWYFDAAWSEEKVVKVPLAIPLHIASVSSEVSRSGGEQTALAPYLTLRSFIK